MILAYIGISFVLGVMLGCHITLPLVIRLDKFINKKSYDMGVQDQLTRSNGRNKKTN